MTTITIPTWIMWLLVFFLVVNAATVGYDTFVRWKIYRLLQTLKRD